MVRQQSWCGLLAPSVNVESQPVTFGMVGAAEAPTQSDSDLYIQHSRLYTIWLAVNRLFFRSYIRIFLKMQTLACVLDILLRN